MKAGGQGRAQKQAPIGPSPRKPRKENAAPQVLEAAVPRYRTLLGRTELCHRMCHRIVECC